MKERYNRYNSSLLEPLAAWLIELTSQGSYSWQQLVVTLVICSPLFYLSVNLTDGQYLYIAPLKVSFSKLSTNGLNNNNFDQLV